MHTPHIDAFARQSTLFTRAYVQCKYRARPHPIFLPLMPLVCSDSFCAPSRNSFLTGRMPDATQAWSFSDHFRENGVGEKWVSMPQWFRENGFYTSGVGKLFHPGLPPNFDAEHSWQRFVSPGTANGLSNRGEHICDNSSFPWIECPKTAGGDGGWWAIDAAKVSGDLRAVAGTGHWCSLDRSKLPLPLEDDAVLSHAQDMLRTNAAHLAERPYFLGVVSCPGLLSRSMFGFSS